MTTSLHQYLARISVIAIGLVLVSCEVNSEASKFADAADAWLDVDAAFPGPQMPSLDSKQTVRSMQGGDLLQLVSGQKITLAGLECNAEMARYTQALFFGSEPDFLVYLPSGYVVDGVQYAYVWAVTLWELGDPDLEFSPATSSLNETGLKSGWCESVRQDSHRYHSRYVAISSLTK